MAQISDLVFGKKIRENLAALFFMDAERKTIPQWLKPVRC